MTIPLLDISIPIVNDASLTMRQHFRYFLQVLTALVTNGCTNVYEGLVLLEDDASIDLESGHPGYGECMIGDDQEWAHFRFTSAGVVTLIDNSANVVNSDTDTNLCIIDSGSLVSIKNRLGSSLYLRYSIKYSII